MLKKLFKYLIPCLVGIGGVALVSTTLNMVSCSETKQQDTSGFRYLIQGDEYIVSWPYFEISDIPKYENGYQEVVCYKDKREFATYTSIENGGVYCNYFEFRGDGYYKVVLKTFNKFPDSNGGVYEAQTIAEGYITKENWNAKD